MAVQKNIWIAGQQFVLKYVLGGKIVKVRLAADDVWYGHDGITHQWAEKDPYTGTPPFPESVLSKLERFLIHLNESRQAECRPARDSKWSNPPLTEIEWASGAPPKGPRIEWSPELLQFELEKALDKGYLILPSSTLSEVEFCSESFLPTSTIELPPTGHIILRFRRPR